MKCQRKFAWAWFYTKVWRHCCHSDGLSHHGNPLALWNIQCRVMWQCWNDGSKPNKTSKLLGNAFRTKVCSHCCHSDGLCHHGNPPGLWNIQRRVKWQCWNGGSKKLLNLLGNVFRTKYDVAVATTTASATITNHWVCGEFDAESCASFETMAQREIGWQNCLEMVFGQNMTSLLQKWPLVPPRHPNGCVESSMLSHMTVFK